ncbi:MAG: DUF72 domain-containing protein [Clostridia bacterium]|jgi:uncharacterized protein YecE (DUF72 family)|nr:DUF72 domain-containing protein [Clostridia bacterium]
MGNILIGTSGFSYDDWLGPFYPEGLAPAAMLPFYAKNFKAVEINFTYYQMPGSQSISGLERKTPAGFTFCLKAHKSMTHEISKDPAEAGEIFHRFRQALFPLVDAGKLGCVLLQFPWGFKYSHENLEYLCFAREALGDLPAVVEFRNAGWVKEEVFSFLSGLNFGFCCVDEPRLRGLMPPVARVTSDLAYLRFHGRNAARWWKHDEPWERYDYLYSSAELQEWIPAILKLSAQAKTTFVFFNNHHAGQAVINARILAELLAAPE